MTRPPWNKGTKCPLSLHQISFGTHGPFICHLVNLRLIVGIFLRSQSYDFDAIVHTGAPLGVE